MEKNVIHLSYENVALKLFPNEKVSKIYGLLRSVVGVDLRMFWKLLTLKKSLCNHLLQHILALFSIAKNYSEIRA